jgi:anti-sigma factor RsiW
MTCGEFEVLVHALIDGELDAGHARKVEMHTTVCSACGAKLASLRALREVISRAGLKEAAPLHLRRRVEALLAVPASPIVSMRSFLKPTRRSFFGGFALGSALSAAAAASLVLTFIHGDQEQFHFLSSRSAKMRCHGSTFGKLSRSTASLACLTSS